jgi:chorismate dehydratase
LTPERPKYKIGAVSFLNPVPLVWGMLDGPQRNLVDLSFAIPSICSRELEEGKIEVGLVPVAEIARQNLALVPGVGITCQGAVRSILLFARKPWSEVKTLAADSSSRTSVQLARVILREKYGLVPEIREQTPSLEEMMSTSDAALIIGDPALLIEPEDSGYEWLDLGKEWLTLTNLPFVFAAWAGKPGIPVADLAGLARGSYEFGRDRMDEIVEREHAARGISKALAHRYLTEHIRYEMGRAEIEGLNTFLELARLRPNLVGATS